jgi:hypothetical protein
VCKLASRDNGYGNHCRRQNEIYSPIADIDYIARFENLQNDFDIICDKIGLTRRELKKYNSYSERDGYRDCYNDETTELVYKTFKTEIVDFNYKF